jgi:hypothetical protein
MTMANTHGDPQLLKQIRALAEERLALLRTSGANFGLKDADQERLKTVERELDEAYRQLREGRAERDRQRFAR